MSSAPLYFDHNATTLLRPAAAAAMTAAMGPALNASSIHQVGRAARQKLEGAREQVAAGLGCRHADITFTSGGTEANNMVLAGFQKHIISAIEHEAVRAACPNATIIGVDEAGIVDLAALEAALAAVPEEERPSAIVSIMAANNETGVIQPLAEIGRLCAAHQVAFHSDMVQALGKMPLDLTLEGLSFASFSAHKIGGPSGVGALWIKPGLQLPSLLVGGGQEQGRRAGTENTLGIIGFGAAMAEASSALSQFQEMAAWRDECEAAILRALPDCQILGQAAPRLPNTISLYFPKMTSSIALMALDLKGICLSSGSACSSGKVKDSHVITAMGKAPLASHVLRISGGWTTEKADFTDLVKALEAL